MNDITETVAAAFEAEEKAQESAPVDMKAETPAETPKESFRKETRCKSGKGCGKQRVAADPCGGKSCCAACCG